MPSVAIYFLHIALIALVDSGADVSACSLDFVKKFKIPYEPLVISCQQLELSARSIGVATARITVASRSIVAKFLVFKHLPDPVLLCSDVNRALGLMPNPRNGQVYFAGKLMAYRPPPQVHWVANLQAETVHIDNRILTVTRVGCMTFYDSHKRLPDWRCQGRCLPFPILFSFCVLLLRK